MCCNSKPQAKRKLLERFGRRKTLTLWKSLRSDGTSAFALYQYGPGTHHAPVKRYNTSYPKGIHVWLDERSGGPYLYRIAVIVHIDDLVRVGNGQAVFTKVRIAEKEWKTFKRRVQRQKADIERLEAEKNNWGYR